MSWLSKIKAAQAKMTVQNADPWLLPLGRVRGHIDFDGLEKITTQMLLDILEVPQHSRRAGTYRRLGRLMVGLGWAPVRVRGLTRGGYKEQIRGYARDTRNGHHSTVPNRECAPVGSSAPV
jgi:hypothetical protein